MYNIAIFASGEGSNALEILKHFENSAFATVKLIVTNRKNAGVLNHAKAFSVTSVYIQKEIWETNPSEVIDMLENYKIDFIALAGFLLKIPTRIIDAFAGKILNIHPALLPAFGGKGMYGMHVHRAVIDSGQAESGISIHEINLNYDEGKIVFQATALIEPGETAESIQKKVMALEHRWFPIVIENYLKGETTTP